MLCSLIVSLAIGIVIFFFFNDTATTEIYTLSLHDALPIFKDEFLERGVAAIDRSLQRDVDKGRLKEDEKRATLGRPLRSEEHTSELQSQSNLVCRLLLEKKKKRR